MTYIILGTLIALGGLIYGLICGMIYALKWKIAALTIVRYCREKFRPPTDTELEEYTREVVEELRGRKR